ncbi:MAG TPA: hypothetical protein VMU09_04095 [Acidimicrobiales bacterium]|nr:hypothetical protein [Acidimicrobiales bacterium]
MASGPDTIAECPECGEVFRGSKAYRDRRAHVERDHSPRASTGVTDMFPEGAPESPVSEDAPAPPAVEAPPAPKRPTVWERVKSRGRGRSGGGPTAAPASGEKAPKKARGGRRVPLDTDISDAWAFLGRRLDATPHYPTGRMLQYQAPAAGLILDKAVAGTLVDRVALQPLARGRDKWEDAAFLVAGPLVTFGITRTMQEMQVALAEGRTEDYQTLARKLELQGEGFTWLIEMMLPRLAEGKRRAEEKKAKTTAVILDAFPELAGTDTSPAELLRDMLFAPPTTWNGAPDGQPDSPPPGDHQQDPMAV